MKNKSDLASTLFSRWESVQTGKTHRPKCFIGFDGFTDEIIHAVDKRTDLHNYKPFTAIADFGHRIIDAGGKSCNIELITQNMKLGGNAPILTNALLNGGHAITFAGAIGITGEIEPIFQEMAEKCLKAYPLCPSAHSDALEFHDGKVILGKLDTLVDINYHTLVAHMGKDNLLKTLDESDLLVCANWTMLPMMTDLWEHINSEMVPQFSTRHPERWLFVDLADPAKRTDEDLEKALEALTALNKTYRVILGLNEAEASRILHVLHGSSDSADPAVTGQEIFSHSDLHMILIHTTDKAAAITSEGTWKVEGPYTSKPKLTTGAGDNFNAGFCNGLLYNLSPEECILSGVATSGFYVRQGKSPTIPELAAFLHKWDEALDPQMI